MRRRLIPWGSALAIALASLVAGAVYGASPDNIAQGKAIAFSRKLGNCVACHDLPGATMPGNIGPRLGPWVRNVFRTKQQLLRYLYDPQGEIPYVVMPEFGKNKILTEDQLRAIADYLWSLKG